MPPVGPAAGGDLDAAGPSPNGPGVPPSALQGQRSSSPAWRAERPDSPVTAGTSDKPHQLEEILHGDDDMYIGLDDEGFQSFSDLVASVGAALDG